MNSDDEVSLKPPQNVGIKYALVTMLVIGLASAIIIPLLHPNGNGNSQRGFEIGLATFPFMAIAYAIGRYRQSRR